MTERLAGLAKVFPYNHWQEHWDWSVLSNSEWGHCWVAFQQYFNLSPLTCSDLTFKPLLNKSILWEIPTLARCHVILAVLIKPLWPTHWWLYTPQYILVWLQMEKFMHHIPLFLAHSEHWPNMFVWFQCHFLSSSHHLPTLFEPLPIIFLLATTISFTKPIVNCRQCQHQHHSHMSACTQSRGSPMLMQLAKSMQI